MSALELPKLPPRLARLCDCLAERAVALPLCWKSAAGEAHVFFLSPLPEKLVPLGKNADWPEERADDLRLTLEADGAPWSIRARGAAARALSAPPESAGVAWEETPPELRHAFLALALDPLLDEASAALGRVFRLRLADDPPDPLAGESILLPFLLSDAAGKPAGSGEARLPRADASLALLEDVAKAFPRRRADVSALPVVLSLCAGREAFPLELLRRIEPGDVLLFTLPAPSLTLEAGGRPLWTAALADGIITLTGTLRVVDMKEMDMTPQAETSAAAPAKTGGGLAPETLDALEIVLTLELDERRMSVGELAALAPGHTFETQAALDAPVTIKANGKPLGTGRLAQVGDRLGVIVATLDIPNPKAG